MVVVLEEHTIVGGDIEFRYYEICCLFVVSPIGIKEMRYTQKSIFRPMLFMYNWSCWLCDR